MMPKMKDGHDLKIWVLGELDKIEALGKSLCSNESARLTHDQHTRLAELALKVLDS